MKTNIGLANYAKKALRENWGYVLGTYGQVLTPSLLSAKRKQGYGVGAYNTRHSTYQNRYRGKMVSDCYGLVKGYVWPKSSNGSAKYVASQDRNQEGAYRAAREKGPIRTIPNTPGTVLWMKGHAGVYLGNGEFIECVGAPIGMRKGRISGGRVVSGSRFTHWFKDTYISYGGASNTVSSVDKTYYSINNNANDKKVTQIQKDLKFLGYDVTVRGGFGKELDKVVRQFQKNNNLKVDGAAGVDTLDRIAQRIRLKKAEIQSSLRYGSRGADVNKLQANLKLLGYDLAVAGAFGKETEDAVKRFQRDNRLVVNGLGNKATLDKIKELLNKPTMAYGSRGSNVNKLQADLKKLDYPVSIGGAFGKETQKAVEHFQVANNLEVTGKVFPYTLDLIKQLLDRQIEIEHLYIVSVGEYETKEEAKQKVEELKKKDEEGKIIQ